MSIVPNNLDALTLQRRREGVFLLLAGLFLSTLAMLNILGITRFIVLISYSEDAGWNWGQWGQVSFALAVGVLPYPLTFLCTDLISEFYGRRRANLVVLVGLVVNLWVIAILWLGGVLPMQAAMISYGQNTAGVEVFAPTLPTANYNAAGQFTGFSEDWTYYRVQMLAFGAVAASMLAYLAAQIVDVQIFHFWKKRTAGRHLWLRNNASTMASQLIDTFAVITITHFYTHALPVDAARPIWPQLWLFIATGYAFKFLAALIDTPVIYLAVAVLKRYLQLDPTQEHRTAEVVLYSSEGSDA